MLWAEIIVYATFVYLAIGVIFALYFVAFQITKYDESAVGTSVFFRVIILFGAIVFWALLTKRLIFNETLPSEVNAHRRKSLEAK